MATTMGTSLATNPHRTRSRTYVTPWAGPKTMSPWSASKKTASTAMHWFSPNGTADLFSGPGPRDELSPLRRHVLFSGERPFKVMLHRGNVQVCQDFPQGFKGRGAERYTTGETYVGEVRRACIECVCTHPSPDRSRLVKTRARQYIAAERWGKGTFKHANGQTLVSKWKDNRPVGEGVQWSDDHRKAARLKNGIPTGSVALDEAGQIASTVGLPVPSDWWATPWPKDKLAC